MPNQGFLPEPLTSGDYLARAQTADFCGGAAVEVAVVIAPERQKTLRIASGQSGDLYLQPSAF